MSETVRKHKMETLRKLRFAIFTVSTSRFAQSSKGERVEDVSGDLVESLLKAAGQSILLRNLISDDPAVIEKSVKDVKDNMDVDAVIFCGGTGITHSDITIETVSPFFEKIMLGFGEIFRRLSYDRIGSAAILSRAIAGVAKGKAFFCIPGSPDAVRLCLENLILPEAGHIVKHARE
jgi:molybdenum cofactor biosynthesis protein B